MGGFFSNRHVESSVTPAYSMKLEVTQLEEYCTEENELGRGGYAVVFKGKVKDIKSGQNMDVAIKRVKRSNAYRYQNNRRRGNIIADDEFKFIAGELAYMKQHDNVFKCLTFDFDIKNPYGSENWYYVMELAIGTLADLFRKVSHDDDSKDPNVILPKTVECRQRMNQLSDLSVLHQIASGLKFLHSENIVHGDIKPENVLISQSDPVRLKLSDFGTYKKVSLCGQPSPADLEVNCGSTSSLFGLFTVTTIRGSPAWTSPELIQLSELMAQAKRKSVKDGDGTSFRCSIASDVFAYGLLSFYYLTRGVHPFGDYPCSSLDDILLKIIPNIYYNRAINFNKNDLPVGDPTRELILTTLRSNPSQRPRASEIVAKLESLKSKDTNVQKSYSWRHATSRWDDMINGHKSWEFGQVWQVHPKPPATAHDEEAIPTTSAVLNGDCVVKKYSLKSMNNDKDQSQFCGCSSDYFNGKATVLVLLASKPHIVITRHESNHIPQAVGLLLPISDVKEIDNATISLIDEDGRKLAEEDHPLLYCLLLKRYNIDNLKCVIRLFGANASKAPFYVASGLCVKSIDDYTASDNYTLYALHIICAFYSSAKNVREIIDLLIESGIDDLNATTEATNLNALHFLCRYHHGSAAANNLRSLIEFLSERGVDLTAKTKTEENVIHLLSQFYPYGEEFKDLIEFMIERGVDPNAKKKNGWNALHLLCRYNCVGRPNFFEIMKLFIDCGINPRDKAAGWSVLQFVCRYYQGDDLKDVVELLIEKEVSWTINDEIGAFSLLCSNYSGNQLKQILTMLIVKGVSRVDETYGKLGMNGLHRICLYYTGENLNEIVSFLCDQGLDINSLTTDGRSALLILCQYYKGADLKQVIETLIGRGINVRFFNENLKFNGNLIATILAYNNVRADLREIVDLLYDKGALSSSTHSSKYPHSLVIACLYYRGPDLLEIVRRIVTASLLHNEKDEKKETLSESFRFAMQSLYIMNNREKRNKDVIKYLRESIKQII